MAGASCKVVHTPGWWTRMASIAGWSSASSPARFAHPARLEVATYAWTLQDGHDVEGDADPCSSLVERNRVVVEVRGEDDDEPFLRSNPMDGWREPAREITVGWSELQPACRAFSGRDPLGDLRVVDARKPRCGMNVWNLMSTSLEDDAPHGQQHVARAVHGERVIGRGAEAAPVGGHGR